MYIYINVYYGRYLQYIELTAIQQDTQPVRCCWDFRPTTSRPSSQPTFAWHVAPIVLRAVGKRARPDFW